MEVRLEHELPSRDIEGATFVASGAVDVGMKQGEDVNWQGECEDQVVAHPGSDGGME